MKIVTVIGARPQFIKAGIVSNRIRGYTDINEIIVHTGQHYDERMSSIFFTQLSIPSPKYNLGIANKSHAQMKAEMILGLAPILASEKPDLVLLYGDTNSTLASALCAAQLGFDIAHVEAGVRSNDMTMPEEINRVITDKLSRALYCPTQLAISNLAFEGVKAQRIVRSGDVMFDAVISHARKCVKPHAFNTSQPYILATLHRASNTDDPQVLEGLVRTLNALSRKYSVVFPIHPRTKNAISKQSLQLSFEPIDPVGYLEMLYLIQNAEFVLTDSGGLQKEAYFLGKHSLIPRNSTEWPELVECGAAYLFSPLEEDVLENFEFKNWEEVQIVTNLFGNGNASEIIANDIASH